MDRLLESNNPEQGFQSWNSTKQKCGSWTVSMATDNIAKFREFFKTHERTKTEKWLWKQTQLQVRVDIITSDILANSWLN